LVHVVEDLVRYAVPDDLEEAHFAARGVDRRRGRSEAAPFERGAYVDDRDVSHGVVS
jgi:hypothetical protein